MPTPSLTRDAYRLLDQHTGGCQLELAWAAPLLPGLLSMLSERPTEPAERLRPIVARLLAERTFASPSDSVSGQTSQAVMRDRTNSLVRILEQVRRDALARGQWSRQPAAPLMCG